MRATTAALVASAARETNFAGPRGGHAGCITAESKSSESDPVAVSRRFVDSDGVHWQAYQVTALDTRIDAGGTHERWLYFFSRGVTRSLTAFPDDWSQLDWPGLERLCRLARPPVRRQPALPGKMARGA